MMMRSPHIKSPRKMSSLLMFTTLSLSISVMTLSTGCEADERSEADGSYSQLPTRGMVDRGSSTEITDATLLDASRSEDGSLALDLRVSDTNPIPSQPPRMTQPRDMAQPIDMSLPEDMEPDMEPDMEEPCIDGERRRGQICGLDECFNGVWRRDRPSNVDICNAHDDDCDGAVDEPPGMNVMSSNCCDSMTCLTRSYCEAGECVSLAEGECRLPGDCEVYERCDGGGCIVDHIINPPESPASCAEPVVLSAGAAQQASGDMSSLLVSTSGLPACGTSRMRDNATLRGREVIFSFLARNVVNSQGLYQLRANVRVNGVQVRSVLIVADECGRDISPLRCIDSGTEQGIDLQMLLSHGTTYSLILDTYGDELEQALLEQRAQYSDVTYTVSLIRM